MGQHCRQRCFIILGLTVVWLALAASTPTASYSSKNPSKIESRSSLENVAETGRSLIIKSMLFAPIGILLLFALAAAFLPVPVISTGRSFKGIEQRAMDLAKNVITSDECIERLSCEVSRVSRRHEMLSWIPQTIGKYFGPSPWSTQISRGMSSVKSCKQFTCDVSNSVRRALVK